MIPSELAPISLDGSREIEAISPIGPSFSAFEEMYPPGALNNERGDTLTLSYFLSAREENNAYCFASDKYHFVGMTVRQLRFNLFLPRLAIFFEPVFYQLTQQLDAHAELARLSRMRENRRHIPLDAGIMGLFGSWLGTTAPDDIFGRLDCFDPVRTGAMVYISHAMNFLVTAHEVEHARAGHCLYANAKSGLDVRLNEIEASIAGLPFETLRFMEHEADFHAAALLGIRIIDGLDPLVGDWCPFDATTRFALATFAACLLPLSWQSVQLDDRDHPKPLTRALTYLSAFEAVVHQRSPEGGPFATAFKSGLENIFRLGREMRSFKAPGDIVEDDSFVAERRGYLGRDNPLERELAPYRFDYAGDRPLRPPISGAPSP